MILFCCFFIFWFVVCVSMFLIVCVGFGLKLDSELQVVEFLVQQVEFVDVCKFELVLLNWVQNKVVDVCELMDQEEYCKVECLFEEVVVDV